MYIRGLLAVEGAKANLYFPIAEDVFRITPKGVRCVPLRNHQLGSSSRNQLDARDSRPIKNGAGPRRVLLGHRWVRQAPSGPAWFLRGPGR